MNRKLHIEMLRIIAVVMVVLNHSDLYYTYYTNTDSVLTFSVSLLLSCICRINVPLFMMITGALLIPKAESWSVIFKKRISRMLVVLVAFSALMYGLQCFAWNQDTFSAMAFVEKLLKNEIQTSYWYLYEYIGILMMLPFLGAIARNVDLDCMKYFLGLGLIVKVGVSMIGQFTGYSMPMSFFVLQNNVFYVLVGYFLEKAVSTEKCRQLSGWKLSVGLAVSVIAAAVMVIVDRKLSGEYHESVLNLMIPLMACVVYLGVRRFFAVHTNIRGAGVIACLGSCAFGVYLLEHIGQKLFLKLYLRLADRTFGIFACSVYICCILLFSFACTWLIRKSKTVRKFI